MTQWLYIVFNSVGGNWISLSHYYLCLSVSATQLLFLHFEYHHHHHPLHHSHWLNHFLPQRVSLSAPNLIACISRFHFFHEKYPNNSICFFFFKKRLFCLVSLVSMCVFICVCEATASHCVDLFSHFPRPVFCSASAVLKALPRRVALGALQGMACWKRNEKKKKTMPTATWRQWKKSSQRQHYTLVALFN